MRVGLDAKTWASLLAASVAIVSLAGGFATWVFQTRQEAIKDKSQLEHQILVHEGLQSHHNMSQIQRIENELRETRHELIEVKEAVLQIKERLRPRRPIEED